MQNQKLLLRNSWPVFANILFFSLEVLTIEVVYVLFNISTVVIAAISLPMCGGILLLIYLLIARGKFDVLYDRTAFKNILLGAVLLAIASFLLYDSIPRIGSAKSMLLNVPSESIFVVVLAWMFLSERLLKRQIVGLSMTIIGCIISIVSGTQGSLSSGWIGIGEMEVMLGGFASAVSIITYAKVLERHHGTEVTGFRLILTGIIVGMGLLLFYPPQPSMSPVGIGDWLSLVTTALASLASYVCFYLGINRVGASITTVLSSVSIILTVGLQLILVRFAAIPLTLAANVPLAAVGGAVSLFGIYLIFRKP